ncbi:hypothetical protein, partial [Kitasatospora sp. NPDC094015]|uniref:hypothetical protein n=1 Tax=Kitasatospora sp. NPDC094015 TaxID=3155205 RepID=UPI003316DF8C
ASAAEWDDTARRTSAPRSAWDGVERRAQHAAAPVALPGRVPWWRDPQRLGGNVLAGVLTSTVLWVVGWIATHVEIHWR